MRAGTIHCVLVLLMLAGPAAGLFGCASTDQALEQIPEVAPLQIPLDKIAEMPIPTCTISSEEAKSVFLKSYMMTLYDRHQRIDKERTPCHEDPWYKVCVEKGKIVATKKRTGKVAQTVDTGTNDFIGDLTKGDGFFTAVYAGGTLHVLYYKTEIDEESGKPKRKVVKRSYPLSGLEFGDKKISIALKDQVIPGYGLWLCTVEKEELTTPLYEIEFIGAGDKTPFIKKLVVQ